MNKKVVALIFCCCVTIVMPVTLLYYLGYNDRLETNKNLAKTQCDALQVVTVPLTCSYECRCTEDCYTDSNGFLQCTTGPPCDRCPYDCSFKNVLWTYLEGTLNATETVFIQQDRTRFEEIYAGFKTVCFYEKTNVTAFFFNLQDAEGYKIATVVWACVASFLFLAFVVYAIFGWRLK